MATDGEEKSGDGEAYFHHRRYEVNNNFRSRLHEAGLVVSGVTPDERLVEVIELTNHPWFFACQYHPEFKSRSARPHPVFRDFVGAVITFACGTAGKAGEAG